MIQIFLHVFHWLNCSSQYDILNNIQMWSKLLNLKILAVWRMSLVHHKEIMAIIKHRILVLGLEVFLLFKVIWAMLCSSSMKLLANLVIIARIFFFFNSSYLLSLWIYEKAIMNNFFCEIDSLCGPILISWINFYILCYWTGQGTTVRVEFGDATAAADPTGAHTISRSFPLTYGQPLAHFLRATAKVPDAQVITDHPALRYTFDWLFDSVTWS